MEYPIWIKKHNDIQHLSTKEKGRDWRVLLFNEHLLKLDKTGHG